MAIDDGKSIYVGGLSFDSTEDILRKAFEEYGEIAAVKIINDRDSGQSRGFGFVTFNNGRAAADAIKGMDGRTVDGRTVKVDEVKNRVSKTTGNEGNFRWRDRDFRNGNGRDSLGRNRQFSPLHRRRASPNNFRLGRGRSPPRRRSRSPRKARSHSHSQERRRTHSRSSPSRASSERLQQNERDERNEAMPADLSKADGGTSKDRKEKSSQYNKQMKEVLEKAILKREQLQDQVTNLETENDNKKRKLIDSQNKGQKIQELLVNAAALALNRHSQLKKLQKAVLEVRECKRKLKGSERDLEALLETVSEDLDAADIGARVDPYEPYGNGDVQFKERQMNDIQSPNDKSNES